MLLCLIEERVELPQPLFVTDLIGCYWCSIAEAQQKLAFGPLCYDNTPRAGTVREFFSREGVAGTPSFRWRPLPAKCYPSGGRICTRIDVAARRIEVRLSEGLKDLDLRSIPGGFLPSRELGLC